MSREPMKHIKTWSERCEEHPDHQQGMVSERMIQERMQEEIDELRQALETEQKTAVSPGKGTGFNYFRALGITSLRQALETEPEALRLADALDAEFVQGRISNSTGRESAVELRRLALKPWVGLTDEQVEDEWERITGHSIFGGDRSEGRAMYISPDEVIEFYQTIEAKLKERNT